MDGFLLWILGTQGTPICRLVGNLPLIRMGERTMSSKFKKTNFTISMLNPKQIYIYIYIYICVSRIVIAIAVWSHKSNLRELSQHASFMKKTLKLGFLLCGTLSSIAF